MPRLLTTLVLTLFFLAAATAQEEDDYAVPPTPPQGLSVERTNFDRNKWETLKKGIDYAKIPEKRRPANGKGRGSGSGGQLPTDGQKGKGGSGSGGGGSGSGFGPGTGKGESEDFEEPEEPASIEIPVGGFGLGEVAKWVFIGLAVAALVYLIVKLAGGGSFGRRNKKLEAELAGIDMEKIEENLQAAELNDPIKRAVAAGNFPLAVRLYYLAVLKELALKNLIRWKREKTNGAYLRELAGTPLAPPFSEVTLIFERVWYGKVELTRDDFPQVEARFKNAIAAVGGK